MAGFSDLALSYTEAAVSRWFELNEKKRRTAKEKMELRNLERHLEGKIADYPSAVSLLVRGFASALLKLRELLVRERMHAVLQLSQAPNDSDRRQEKRPKKLGRPSDTNQTQDRRIFEAWGTGRYESKAALARAFRITEHQAIRAIDRQRKRKKASAE